MKHTRGNISDDPHHAKKQKMANDSDSQGGGQPMEIDENLHSRQLAVYGREVMKRMAASSVLISGMNGLGVETGKSQAVYR